MIVKCMYCHRVIKVFGGTEGISHGICGDCLPHALGECHVSMREYLENIPEPALLVNRCGVPVAANRRFKETIAASTAAAITLLESTKHPVAEESIEHIAEETDASGNDLEHVPTSIDIDRPEEHRHLNLLVGTMRIGHNVIVRIEELSESLPGRSKRRRTKRRKKNV